MRKRRLKLRRNYYSMLIIKKTFRKLTSEEQQIISVHTKIKLYGGVRDEEERWSSKCEIEKVLKVNSADPVLKYENGKCWTHDGEGHVMVLGVTGSGKSRRGIIPTVKILLKTTKVQSLLMLKVEIFKNTQDDISQVYDLHVIDFRNLYEDNEGWNPLAAPYELWASDSKKDRHIAEQMIEELAHTMYPESEQQDPFWIKEARNLFVGLVYALFILGNLKK